MYLVEDYREMLERQKNGSSEFGVAAPPIFTPEQDRTMIELHRLEESQYEKILDPERQELLIRAFNDLKPAAFLDIGRLELMIDEENWKAALCYTGDPIIECGPYEDENDGIKAAPILQTFSKLTQQFGVLSLIEKDGRFQLRLDADLYLSKKVRDLSDQIREFKLQHPF